MSTTTSSNYTSTVRDYGAMEETLQGEKVSCWIFYFITIHANITISTSGAVVPVSVEVNDESVGKLFDGSVSLLKVQPVIASKEGSKLNI